MSSGDDARNFVRLKVTLYRREDPYLVKALAALDPIARVQYHRFLVRQGLMFSGTPLLPLLSHPQGIPDGGHIVADTSLADSDDRIRLDVRICKQEDPHLCLAFDALDKTSRLRFHKYLLRHGFLFAGHAPSIMPQWLPMTPGSPSPSAIVPDQDKDPEFMANIARLSGEVDF